MALFVHYANRERNPLGGREADGFDQWLTLSERMVREARESLSESLPAGHAGRYMAVSAARDYGYVLREWQDVKAGRSDHVRDDLARDHFEVGLISEVMGAYGAAQYARERGYGPDDVTAGGRPMADVSAEYLRSVLILSKYTGVDELTITGCRDIQGALVSLRNTRN